MAKTHLTPPRGDDSRAEALLCFGGSGWETRERGMGGGAACHLDGLSALWRDRAVQGRETEGLSTMD